MDQTFYILVVIVLLIIGLIGTFLPVLPGLVLSFAGLLMYKFLANPEFSMIYIWIFGILTVVSIVLNYLIPAKTNRKYGGTRWGSIGSIVGTILGLIFFPPFGFFIGMLLGVFLGELLHDSKDKQKALNSVKGAFLGFIYGTGFNFMVGLAMLLVVLFDVIW